MRKYIPNLLTCLNLAIGCIGIHETLVSKRIDAFYFVVMASFFDFFDGLAARLLKVQSAVGKQLDSLADLISFGLLPAFFMLQLLYERSEYYLVAILIVIFSALRLAIFNVDESQNDSFKGLPTPANALMLTSLIFIPFDLQVYSLISICFFSSLMLVSPIKLTALKFSSFGWVGNEERWIVILSVIIFIIVFKWTFIPFLIPYYIVVSLLSN
ncbi:MAG: CDP-diacylglycerol--serine O-phosphatidyltransferase, partial [Bacteroidota bacterium]